VLLAHLTPSQVPVHDLESGNRPLTNLITGVFWRNPLCVVASAPGLLYGGGMLNSITKVRRITSPGNEETLLPAFAAHRFLR